MTLIVKIINKIRNLFAKVDVEDEEERYGFLPQKHWFAHNYCYLIHDFLLESMASGEKADLFSTVTIRFDSEEAKESFIKNKGGKEITDWMGENGYSTDVIVLFYKRVLHSLLSDMLHYIYEALRCSKRGKLSVAYTLLRKPIKENLFYLEWMLAEPVEFLFKFWKQDINDVDITGNDKGPEFKKSLIKKIQSMEGFPKFETPESLYELRYDKKSIESFEPICQQAHHLVTTNKHYKTTNTNFNFVFSMQEDKEAQWEFLYSHLPRILLHTYFVVENLLKNLSERAASQYDPADSRILIGYYLWHKHGFWGDYGENDILPQLKELVNFGEIVCPYCESNFDVKDDNIYQEFFEAGTLNCSNCSKKTDLVELHQEMAKAHIAQVKNEIEKNETE